MPAPPLISMISSRFPRRTMVPLWRIADLVDRLWATSGFYDVMITAQSDEIFLMAV